jgi:outer membrane protein OmpA-like peptidoglycan-associated protein
METNSKTMIIPLASLVLVLAITGCRAKSTVVLVPDPDGNVGQLVVANEGGQRVLDKTNQSVQVTDQKAAPSGVTTLAAEKIRAIFSEALAAQPLPPAKFILYFLPDSNELTDESKTILPQIIQTIRERSSSDIVISGHTDMAGEKEYNFKLALGRAQATSEILVASGVVTASITVTSHGEGNPLVKTADGVEEPRNRRVEVVIK